MEEKSEETAPVETLSHDENCGLTGYFNDGHKRIDLVLVFKDNGSDIVKRTRINFLMNLIKFGLEAEVDTGKMLEHRNLMFVKLHAPDAIIEEFGLYFNEKSLFKDSHLEFVNPIVNIFGMSNERELIKIVRKQYPGPDNYSTLERSNIVYKILLYLPFEEYLNHFGINELIDNHIIQDVFALHDGPYFILPQQRLDNINARQVLFFEWLGTINVWKLQPIHMIHEYFGKRISYYFTFYQYFNFMLIIPSIVGAFTIIFLCIRASEKWPYTNIMYYCSGEMFMFPECRNFSLCPIVKQKAYCERELKLLAIIDRETTQSFGIFMVIWGIFFLMPWIYTEKYLAWIWEDSKSYTNDLVRTTSFPDVDEAAMLADANVDSFATIVRKRCASLLYRIHDSLNNILRTLSSRRESSTNISFSEYKEHKMKSEKEKTAKRIIKDICGRLWRMFIYLSTAICLSFWAFVMFRFSIVIWHYPRWKSLQAEVKLYAHKYGERENIAVGAGIYTILVYPLKIVFCILAKKVTDYENYKRFVSYERSIAFKMYAFSFIGSFFIFITYTFVGVIFKNRFITLKNDFNSDLMNVMNGFGFMNCGAGSTFDDICITLGVMTVLEHVIFRVAGFLIRGKTDYPMGFKRRVPCWEREYKLKPINEFFFHKLYNSLAMQFALLTCYSMMFPLAPLILFIINIWDSRQTARQLLLQYRRPLWTNTSGPGFWKFLIFITAFYAPMSNTAIILFQSLLFEVAHFRYKTHYIVPRQYMDHPMLRLFGTKRTIEAMKDRIKKTYRFPDHLYYYAVKPDHVYHAMGKQRTVLLMFLTTIISLVLGFFLFYVIPKTSNSLEAAIKKEQRIKKNYQIRRSRRTIN